MSVIALQSQNVPLPSASSGAPEACEARTDLNANKTQFRNLLDQAMKDDDSRESQQLAQMPTDSSGKKHKPSPRSKHSSANGQTPAVIAVPADSNNNKPLDKLKEEVSVKNSASEIMPQHSPGLRRKQGLEEFAAQRFQSHLAETQQADGSSTITQNARTDPQLPSQEKPINNNPSMAPNSQARSSEAATAHPGEDKRGAVTINTGSRLPLSRDPLQYPDSAQKGLFPLIEGAKNPERTSDSNVQPGENLKEIPTLTRADMSAQNLSDAQLSAAPDRDLQAALKELEDLHLNNSSATSSRKRSPDANNPPVSKASMPQNSDGSLPSKATSRVRQKQAAVNLQNPGKDNRTANTHKGIQNNVNSPQVTSTTPGASSDSPKDEKSGQDSPDEHFLRPQTPAQGNALATGSFNSAKSTATNVSSGIFPAASAQGVAANGTPTGIAATVQTATSHPVAANTLRDASENLSPAGSIVNSASMLKIQGKTEMRVALQTDKLGPVELHAVLEAGHVGASIAVSNHDAHTILSNNLPALQQALTDQNLRLDHLSVLNSPMGSGTNTGNGGASHSGGNAQSQHNTPQWSISHPVRTVRASEKSAFAEQRQGQLSVRA